MYKPSYGSYFYLTEDYSNPVRHVKTVTLKRDIERGVKHLSEWSYAWRWGATRTSLRFLNALKKHIDVTATHAELRYSRRKHWTLIVKTVDGYTLLFKGVSGGYFGEGTRGCYDILKACGFSESQCQKVWKQERFKTLKKSV